MNRRRSAGGARAVAAADLLPEDIAADPDVDPDSAARTICLRLLTARSRTRAELLEALRTRDVADEVAVRVLNRFAEVGLIDDASFAETFVSTRHAERGLAKREIARQLRSKGVADHVVNRATAEICADQELEMARQLVARKMRSMSGLDPQAQVRRLVGMLARKGYTPAQAYQVVRDATDVSAAEQDGDTAWLA